MKPVTSIQDRRYVKAMSHPLRVRILALLDERTASPVELAEVLEASLGTVSYHVRTLHQLGLIDLVDETRVRGAVEHHYRSRARPRITDEAWAQAPPIARQAAVGSSLQMIDEYARASAAAGGFDHSDAALIRVSMRLDEKGWHQLAGACKKLLDQAQRIEAEAAERLGKVAETNHHAMDVGLVTMLFEAISLREALAGDDQGVEHKRRGARRGRPTRATHRAGRA
jgi:DNA-binding transcriptional ArsR family regulator